MNTSTFWKEGEGTRAADPAPCRSTINATLPAGHTLAHAADTDEGESGCLTTSFDRLWAPDGFQLRPRLLAVGMKSPHSDHHHAPQPQVFQVLGHSTVGVTIQHPKSSPEAVLLSHACNNRPSFCLRHRKLEKHIVDENRDAAVQNTQGDGRAPGRLKLPPAQRAPSASVVLTIVLWGQLHVASTTPV